MSSSFRKTVEKFAEAQSGDCMPCHWCRAPTKRETLAQYGARCFSCFEAYCQEPQGKAKPQPSYRNVLAKPSPEATPQQIDAAKAEARRKAIDYARKFGISLDEAQTLLDGGRGSRAPAFAGHQARAEAGR